MLEDSLLNLTKLARADCRPNDLYRNFKMSHTHYVKYDRKPTERTTG